MSIKKPTGFNNDKCSVDGLRSICRDCSRPINIDWKNNNKEKSAKSLASWVLRNKDKVRKGHAEYSRNNKEKRSAKDAVHNEIRRGRMHPPASCSMCGKECRPDAHHEDYSKPIDVVWLCKSCHGFRHSEIRDGEKLCQEEDLYQRKEERQ